MSTQEYWGIDRVMPESDDDQTAALEDRLQTLLLRCWTVSRAQAVCHEVSGFRPDIPVRRAYVYEGHSGWTAAFLSGNEVRYLHGFPTSADAVRVVSEHYDAPPDFQHGFNTVVPLEE